MKHFKIVLENHTDGYVAYPIGINGVIIGQGDTAECALNDVASAIKFHIETFGMESLETESPLIEASISETEVLV